MNKEFLLTLLASLAVGGCATQNPAPTPEQKIDRLLADLAKKPAPEKLATHFASCYAPAASEPERIEYVCRFCGGKTILKSTKDNTEDGSVYNWSFKWTIPDNRKLIEIIQNLGLDAMLDERALCDECRPKLDPAPTFGEMYLIVWHKGKTTRTLLERGDLIKLRAFLEGKLVWAWHGLDDEKPLKPELPRIRRLLGLESIK